MKKIIFLSLLILVPLFCYAQDANSVTNELGLNLSGTTFGIRYIGGKGNTLLRLTFISLGGSNSSSTSSSNTKSKSNSQGLGFNLGFEKRKPVSENLCAYFGSDLLTSFSRNIYKVSSLSETSTNLTFSPGLGFVLGFNFKISSKINISAEVMPSISYSYTKNTVDNNGTTFKSTSTGFDYGLRTNGLNLTLSYTLGK